MERHPMFIDWKQYFKMTTPPKEITDSTQSLSKFQLHIL